jgi:hypothetical protein
MDRTTGVLTNCDRVRSDDADQPRVHVLAHLIRDDHSEHNRAVGGGWHAVANASSAKDSAGERLAHMPQREANALHKLTTRPTHFDMDDEEAARFDDDAALVAAHWGMDRLRQREQTAYEAFIDEHWESHIRGWVLQRLEVEHNALGRLGVPFRLTRHAVRLADDVLESVRVYSSEEAPTFGLWSQLAVRTDRVTEAIEQQLTLCIRNFVVGNADGSVLRGMHDRLEAVTRDVATNRTFSTPTAQDDAFSFAANQRRELERAVDRFHAEATDWLNNGVAADAFICFAMSFDDPDPNRPLQLCRFESALETLAQLLRGNLSTVQNERPLLPSDVFDVWGSPFEGPVTVRCHNPRSLRAVAQNATWRLAAAVHTAVKASIATLVSADRAAISNVTEEADRVSKEREAILGRCVAHCRLLVPHAAVADEY